MKESHCFSSTALQATPSVITHSDARFDRKSLRPQNEQPTSTFTAAQPPQGKTYLTAHETKRKHLR